MIKYFEMSVLGPEIIKGNIRSVETEKCDDCSKNTIIIYQLVKLFYSPWHQYPILSNLYKCCSKQLKYYIQVYVYLPVFKDFFTIYLPFICHNLWEARTCLFPILRNIYETLTLCSLQIICWRSVIPIPNLLDPESQRNQSINIHPSNKTS